MIDASSFCLLTKYKPKTFDDYIATASFRQELVDLDSTNVGVLMHGVGGTGKSTAADILMRNVPKENIRPVNCSEERGISEMRALREFARYRQNCGAVVRFEEFERITPEALGSLRTILDDLKNVGIRYIATCNDLSVLQGSDRIKEAVLSRFHKINFDRVHGETEADRNELRKDCVAKLIPILKSEGIKYTKEGIRDLVLRYSEGSNFNFRDMITEVEVRKNSGIVSPRKGKMSVDIAKAIEIASKTGREREVREYLDENMTSWEALLRHIDDNVLEYFDENGDDFFLVGAILMKYEERLHKSILPRNTVTVMFRELGGLNCLK